jgi:glycosyltransferase involved in cell wall biosynthesis
VRTLHVEAGRHDYGGARQVAWLVEGLAARGHACVLAVPEGSALAARAWPAAVELAPLQMRGDLDLALVARLVRLMRRHRPAVVHLHSRRGADWLGGLAARLAGVPCVLTRRVDNPESRAVAALKYRLFDRVVAISAAVQSALENAGVPAGKLARVHSAVDAAAVASDCDRAAFRAAFELPADGPVLGMVAQFIPRKGHRLLLEALPRVLERHPATHVVLFGQGPLQDEVRRLAEAAGLAGRLRFAGFRAELPRLYACLDLLVHPASAEGLGVALLEAGAAGVPAVACRAGGVPEVVLDGESGLLVAPGDAAALAEAITRLLDSADLRTQYGAAARRHVASSFSVAAMVAGYEAIYGGLA